MSEPTQRPRITTFRDVQTGNVDGLFLVIPLTSSGDFPPELVEQMAKALAMDEFAGSWEDILRDMEWTGLPTEYHFAATAVVRSLLRAAREDSR